MKKQTKKTLIGVAIGVVVLAALSQLPLKDWLEPLWDYIQDAGAWGYFIFLVVGTLCSLLMLPISPVVVASGLLFGFWIGLGMSLVVLLLSSAIAFELGGHFWDRFSHHSAFQNKYFKAIRKAIESEGVYLVGLLRLTPFIHFTVGNLFYGSLSLKFWRFLFASMLGMLPGTAIFVYAGYLARRSFGEDVELNGWQIALFGVGVLVFAGITWLVTRKTRRILREEG